MTRPLRLEIPNGISHVTSRGIAKQTIYLDDEDCHAFVQLIEDVVVRHQWRCLAYCLMGNHYHLLIQTPLANLGLGMRDLNSQYVSAFNRRHDRDGGLLKRPYKAQLVQSDRYLLAAARYIALNPVRAGLAQRPEAWRWSSYGDLWRGADSALLPMIDTDHDHARRQFINLVRDGAGLPPFNPEKAIFGDAAFVARHAPELPPEQPVERRAWEQARPPLQDVASRYGREEAIARARIDYRYTVKEIAGYFGCSTETVRRRLKMWDVRTSPR